MNVIKNQLGIYLLYNKGTYRRIALGSSLTWKESAVIQRQVLLK